MSNRVTSVAVLAMLLSCASNALAQHAKNEVATSVSILSRTISDNDLRRTTVSSSTLSYAWFFTERFAAGPIFRVRTVTGAQTSWYFGGLGRVYCRDQDAAVIPVLEANVVRSLHDLYEEQTTIQALAGLVFPMGTSGARIRIAPYYSRTIYRDDGPPSFNGFGVSWNVSLLF